MSAPPKSRGEPITDKRQLVDYLADGCKPRSEWRIGTEHEKFGFNLSDLRRAPYEGRSGIRALLEGLTRFGWEPIEENGKTIALTMGRCSITLEPGGQFELSGAPLETMHQTCGEVGTHLDQVREVASELGVGLLGLGFEPKWRREDIHWMPKGRYKIMRDYMPKGKLGLDMMLRTCTVQVNLDFSSEADMVKKFRVAGAAADRHGAVRQFALHRGQAERLHQLPQPYLDRHRSRPLRHAALRVRGRLRLRALCRLHARCADVFRLSRRQVYRRLRPVLPRFHGRASCRPIPARRRAWATGPTTSRPPSPRCG